MKWRGMEHSPRLYALTTRRQERQLRQLRARLIGSLHGAVLELGCGIGYNFRHYAAEARVIATDVDPANLRFATQRADHPPLLAADAQAIPCRSHSMDHVVATLMLCSVPFPALALGEIVRVLRPDGQLHLLEHTLTDHAPIDWLLHRIERPWGWLTGGCHPNRDTAGLLAASGWQLATHKRLAGGFLRVIVARPPA